MVFNTNLLSPMPRAYPVGKSMTLYVWQTDRFKTGMLSLSLAQQTSAERAPATSLLFSTLKRGTECYPSLAKINERLDNLYAASLAVRNYRCGDRQVVGLCTEFLDNRYLDDPEAGNILDGCVEMMAQMLLHPLTDAAGLLLPHAVESEKINLCDAIRARQNNPRLWAALRLSELMYVDEPCGIPLHGSVSQIMAMTREQLQSCHQQWLDDSELVFFYVGPEDPCRVVDVLRRHFESFAPTSIVTCPPTKVIRQAASVREISEDMAVSQGKLNLGFRTGVTLHDTAYHAMAVANEIYGASPISKLFMQVREQKSLCYSIGSSYDLYKGTMKVSCGIDPKMRDITKEEILRQWEAISRGEITEEELAAAKHSLENSYRTIEDNPNAIEGFYYGRLLEGVDMTVEDCRRGFAAVTREQVAAVAAGITLDTVYFLHGTRRDDREEEEECDFDDAE